MAHPDMDELLNESLHAAEEFLEKIGEFFPFVVTMSPEGEISHEQEHLGEEPPAGDEAVDVLIDGLKQAAAKGRYKATALVSHAQVPSPDGQFQEAISVALEHRNDPPVVCYLPFKQTKGRFDYGEVFAKRGQRKVFPHTAEKAAAASAPASGKKGRKAD
ncbi:MAG TPA: hypothetical protein VKB78_01400 [Pirellulales bacterium]|nr:hypothetical protein [Pirellulales bacterium]